MLTRYPAGLVMLCACWACGSRASRTEGLKPTDAFAGYEQKVPTPTPCGGGDGEACSSIAIESSEIGGSFLFQDALSECSITETSLSVGLRNSNTLHATFNLSLVINYATTPSLPYVAQCVGPEQDSSKLPSVSLKPAFCAVSILLHGKLYSSALASPCSATITSLVPLSGTLECPQLSSEGRLLVVSPESSFTCAR